MNETQYDILIMGTGPAGITASLFAQRQGLTTAVFGDIPGGILYMIENLADFPGFPGGISGTQLGTLIFSQAQAEGAFFPMACLTKLGFADGVFSGTDTNGQTYTGRCAIVATGRTPEQLPGVDPQMRGVHFCSVCDGPLYRDKQAVLAVIGGCKAAAQHALTVSKVAARVYLVCPPKSFRMAPVHESQISRAENISVLKDTEIVELKGPDQVETLVVAPAKETPRELAVDGVFLAVGWRPNTDSIDIEVQTTREGYLKTDQRLMTSHPGLFAAGDVRDTNMHQVLTACADGARAARYAMEYIGRL